MSGGKHVDSDVETAVRLRTEMIDVAIKQGKGDRNHEPFASTFEAMKTSRVYVWEPPAMLAFWRFWENKRVYNQFMDQFFDRNGLLYKQDMVASEFHMFQAPGRSFGEDLLAPLDIDFASSIIFP